MSEKKKIFSELYRTELKKGNIDFREVLAGLAGKVLNKSPLDASAFADLNVGKYWNWLRREAENHKLRGLVPIFDFPLDDAYVICSPCHKMLEADCVNESRLGKLALSRSFIMRQINLMTDRQYEALACVICGLLGGSQVKLTPPGNEGGVDFFAKIAIKGHSHIFSGYGAELRIIGQCKKYKTPVSVDRIEQFITTIQNVKHRSPRVASHIPSWFADSKGPIVGWVISHEGFQTGSADEAKNHGIIVSDSLDIAEVIGLSADFFPDLIGGNRAMQLEAKCAEWLLA